MLATEEGMVTSFSAVQPQNIWSSKAVRPLGRTTLSSAVQPQNAEEPRCFNVEGRVTFFKDTQLIKALGQMSVTPSGMVMEVMGLLSAKASSKVQTILVTPWGTVTLLPLPL